MNECFDNGKKYIDIVMSFKMIITYMSDDGMWYLMLDPRTRDVDARTTVTARGVAASTGTYQGGERPSYGFSAIGPLLAQGVNMPRGQTKDDGQQQQ